MIYLVSPSSLREWFEAFCERSSSDRVHFIGNNPAESVASLLKRIEPSSWDDDEHVVVYASHESMARDGELARQLSAMGYRVTYQSEEAIRIGCDKLAMKRFFREHGFSTPAWWASSEAARDHSATWNLVVAKGRKGTQGLSNRLIANGDGQPGDEEFAERFVHGHEYSVNVFRTAREVTVFPPVWKGLTRTDLRPPYRRLRLCPYDSLDYAAAEEMIVATVRLANLLKATGFLEVEFVLTPEGALILEVNPRISGTMRISAMATDTKILSFPAHQTLPARLRPTLYAAELPYHGPPVRSKEAQVYCTSRLTVSGASLNEVRQKLDALERAGTVPDAEAVRDLDRCLAAAESR
jgi:predicted ATP-grasp superfamily ATP-dependent carboligase